MIFLVWYSVIFSALSIVILLFFDLLDYIDKIKIRRKNLLEKEVKNYNIVRALLCEIEKEIEENDRVVEKLKKEIRGLKKGIKETESKWK